MKQLSIIPDDGFVIVARERSQQKSEHIWIDNAGCVNGFSLTQNSYNSR